MVLLVRSLHTGSEPFQRTKLLTFQSQLKKLNCSILKLFLENKLNCSWKIINQILQFKDQKPKFIGSVTHGNKDITSPQKICEVMNNHFTDVGPKLAGKIPKSNVSFTKYLGRRIRNSIVLKETDPFEILSLISLLDPKKAVGYDGISCKTIKLLAYVISPILSDIFNHALQHGKFPDSFKVAKIIPLHKGGKSNVVNNYRPISILSTLSKLFEKVINKRLVDFFEKYNVINDFQFGFREGYSTTLALTEICDHFRNNLDNREITCGVFVDLAKAFDTVNHSILLTKLEHYGVRGNALSLLTSYLKNRTQFTQINHHASAKRNIVCGVPLGSVLGPLLFLVYVNDICNTSDFNVRLFADDTLLFMSSKEAHTLEYNVNLEIGKMQLWLQANKLSINISKTKYMIVSPKFKSSYEFKIELLGNLLEQVDSHKYLGVIIDDVLSWQPHTAMIAVKLSRLCGLMYKLRNYTYTAILKKVFYALVQPVIHYGLICWGSCSESIKRPIEILLNRILRCINFVKVRQMHVSDLYALSKVLTMKDAYKAEVCKFVYKVKQNAFPEIFSNYFSECRFIHNYSTRQALNKNFFLARKQKAMGQRSLQYRGTKFWNELPNSVKSANHFKAFVKLLTCHLIASY